MAASFRTIPLLQPVVFAVLLHVLWAANQCRALEGNDDIIYANTWTSSKKEISDPENARRPSKGPLQPPEDARLRAPNTKWTSAAALPQCTADWSTTLVDTVAAPKLTSPCNVSRLFPTSIYDFDRKRYDPADFPTLWYKIEKGSVPSGQRMVVWLDIQLWTEWFGILVMSDPTEGCKEMYYAGFFGCDKHCFPYSSTDNVAFMVNSSTTYYIAISKAGDTPPRNLKLSCTTPDRNTDFRKAKTLTCNGSTHGSTVGARGIDDDLPCLASNAKGSGYVWFKLPPEQPPSKVQVTLKSESHSPTISMMVFVAGSKRRWDECATFFGEYAGQLSEVNFSTDGNSTYYVAVFEDNGEKEGGFDLHTTCSVPQRPTNDDWTNAASITKCNSSVAIDTNEATRDETYPCTFKGPLPKDSHFVWFKIQPSQVARKKVVQIGVVRGNEDFAYERLLILGRRESDQVGDECTLYMSSIRGDNFEGKIEFVVDGVSTYYVAIAFSQFDFTGVLNINCLDGVPNDSFEDAQPITCGNGVSGDLRGATWERSPLGYSTTTLNNFPCVRSPNAYVGTYGVLPYVWYIWDSSKAPSGSRVSANITRRFGGESGMESVVLVQAEMGQWGGACQFDAPLPIHSDGKSSYYIGVKSVSPLYEDYDKTAYTLKLICENDAPRNFDFHHAIPLSCNKTASGTTKGVPTNMKNQLPCKPKNKAFPATGMVWFVVTGIDAPDSSTIEIKQSGSSEPAKLRLVVFGARKSGTPNDRCKKEDTAGLEKVVIYPTGNAVYYVGVYEKQERSYDETPAPTGTDFTLDMSCFIKESEDPNYDYQTAAPIRCTSPPTRIQTSANSSPLSTLPCNGTSKYFNHTHILWYKLQKDSVHQGQRVVVELEYRWPKGAKYPEKFGLAVLRGLPSCSVVALHGCNSKGCVGVGEHGWIQPSNSLGQIVFTPDHDDGSEYYIAVSRRWATTTRALTLTCQDIPTNIDYHKAIPVQCNKEISGTTAGSAGAEHKLPCDTMGGFSIKPNDVGVWYILQRDNTPTVFDVNITVNGSTHGPKVQVFGAKDENDGEDSCWMMSEYDYRAPDGNIAVFQHDPSIAEFIYVFERDSRVDGGPFTLQVTCGKKVQPAPNDHYKSASPIDCSTNKNLDLRHATFDTELPCEVDASMLPSYRYKFLWYKFPDGQPTRQKVVRMQSGEWRGVTALVLGRKADKSSSSRCTFVKFERHTTEISFRSDGVSTYFIGLSESDYPVVAMKSTCLDATANDNFEDALPITCNTTLNGTLKGVSEDVFVGVNSGYSLTPTNNIPCKFSEYGGRFYIWYKFDGATTPVDLVITATQSGIPDAQVRVMVPKDPKQVNGECLYEASSPFASDGSSIYYIGIGIQYVSNDLNGQPFSVTLTC